MQKTTVALHKHWYILYKNKKEWFSGFDVSRNDHADFYFNDTNMGSVCAGWNSCAHQTPYRKSTKEVAVTAAALALLSCQEASVAIFYFCFGFIKIENERIAMHVIQKG